MSQSIPRPERFLTEATRDGNAFQVLRFDVVHDVAVFPLLATNSSDVCLLSPVWSHVLTSHHQTFHLFIQFLNITYVNSGNFIIG